VGCGEGQSAFAEKGAVLRITFDDARRGSLDMDLTVEEAQKLTQGKAGPVARRGHRPKAE
jgi:hypothetical protein